MSKHPAAALPLALLICGAAFAQQAFEPIGLPSSRSSSPVFNRYLSLPPFTARIPGEWEWTAAGDLQISQMIAVIEYSNPDGSTYMDPILDYETLSLEAPLALGLGRGFALELDLQVQLLWSGVLDDTVQGFHRIFGFPNGGRDRVRSYRCVVDLPTRNGFDLSLDGAAVLVSDPVLSLAWAFYRGERLALTSRLLFAAPLGLGRGLAGTELPQNGAGFWADWRASRRLGVYANAGAVLPWEALRSGPAPLSMAQARLSVLFETIPGLFVYGNLDFKTSPLDSAMDYVGADPFLEPNTDLTVGLVWTPGAARADGRFRAFGVQEDPITHNGADISWTGSAAWRGAW